MFQEQIAQIVDVQAVVNTIFKDQLHKKRQLSLAYAALGLLTSGSLNLHKMGQGMAKSRGVDKKHATKQIDRLLSNPGLNVWKMASQWIPYVVGTRTELMVALDWTSFANDSQQMLSLNVLTSKGCSTPLLWRTVEHHQLKSNRARYEDQMLSQLKANLPQGVHVTLVADRGFADKKFFTFIEQELGFNYIIRIRKNTTITDHNGVSQAACAWKTPTGKLKSLCEASLTRSQQPIERFVIVQDKKMKQPWCLVSNLKEIPSRVIVKHYAKRWKIEPYFRDVKDGRYGYGLRQTHLKNGARRDRLFFIVALCYTLLILLGQAGENIGFDALLKVNTVKARTHSLFRQGQFYLEFFLNFTPQKQQKLVESFGTLLLDHPFWLAFYDLNK